MEEQKNEKKAIFGGKRPAGERGLTKKQQLFAQEYLVDLNATQAAIRAGYSAKSARVKGCDLLKDPRIKEIIDKRLEELAERTRMTQEQVFQELVKVAKADMTTFATWGPEGVTFRPSSELRPEDTAAVAEISQTVTEHGGTRRIRLHDKLKALELLGRYFSMFNDNVNLKSDVTINVKIEGEGWE